MLTEVVNATNAIEGFASYIDSYWVEQPYQNAIGGWNMPPLSRMDLALRARRLSDRLKALPDDSVDENFKVQLENLPNQLAWFQANTLPYMQNGNAPQVLANFDIIMSNIEQAVPLVAMPDWDEVAKSDLVPRDLARRIRSLEAALVRLEPRTASLSEKVERINEAHAAASDLPTDLQALKEARDEVVEHAQTASVYARSAKECAESAKNHVSSISSEEETARNLIANIDAAYSAATTVGLAAAFNERAKQLGMSTWVWVGLLLASLAVGGAVGHFRLQSFQAALVTPGVGARWIWLSAAMSVLTVAAPVWFAWVATRQIAQRFRLAEDYAFKASVARAYEGYRKEAARLDPELEARLFASALDRLEEAPLRFLAVEEHSSPYEAILASPGFQKALEKIPDFRETALELINRTSDAGRKSALGRSVSEVRGVAGE